MNKPKFETPDLTAENVAKIAELFPGVVAEGKVNFDLLRSMLGEEVFGDEAYEFTWVGKRAAIAEAGRPIRKTLRPCVEESKDWDTTENLYIEGDNLDVLKLLQESYLGKVKMIYIDPPYNTGNDFIYRDDFKQSREEYEDEAGMYDEDGERLFKNTETNGRFHSDWCSMIYPRLVLARNMLLDDGVIFISIDDGEVAQLRKICDEVFGNDNFVNVISVNMKSNAGASGGGEDKRLKKNCEFVLVYAKNYYNMPLFQSAFEYTEIHEVVEQYRAEQKNWHYTSVIVDEGEKVYACSTVDGDGNEIKIYRRPNAVIKSIRQIMTDEGLSEKEVYYQYGTKIFEAKDAQSSIRTRVINSRIANSINDDVLSIEYIPKTGRNKGQLYEQFYKGDKCRLFAWLRDITEVNDGVLYKKDKQGTYWDLTAHINNLTKEGGVAFPNGKKPIALIKRMSEMITDEKDIILDFFSGSATTAHAVMQLNAEDGGKRKFIMVQLPEVCADGSEAAKAGYKTICDIGKERIRRAGDKIEQERQERIALEKHEEPQVAYLIENGQAILDSGGHLYDEIEKLHPPIDIGFRVLKLDETNMTDVYYAPCDYTQDLILQMEDNIKPGRTDMDLLYGCLLDWGLPLSMPHTHEEIDGFTVHTYNDGDLIACFEERISEKAIREIAGRKPLRAVFRDSSFVSSPEKINVFEIFKLLAPNTNVKVI